VRLGVTGGDRVQLSDLLDASVSELKAVFDSGLEDAL
jgi:hypothetical protein